MPSSEEMALYAAMQAELRTRICPNQTRGRALQATLDDEEDIPSRDPIYATAYQASQTVGLDDYKGHAILAARGEHERELLVLAYLVRAHIYVQGEKSQRSRLHQDLVKRRNELLAQLATNPKQMIAWMKATPTQPIFWLRQFSIVVTHPELTYAMISNRWLYHRFGATVPGMRLSKPEEDAWKIANREDSEDLVNEEPRVSYCGEIDEGDVWSITTHYATAEVAFNWSNRPQQPRNIRPMYRLIAAHILKKRRSGEEFTADSVTMTLGTDRAATGKALSDMYLTGILQRIKTSSTIRYRFPCQGDPMQTDEPEMPQEEQS